MKEFIDLFQSIAKDKRNVQQLKDGIRKAIGYLDKAKEWLSKIPEDEFNKAVESAGVKAREKLANMVRDGTINEEYLEKVHRMTMTSPSDITRGWEEVVNLYYNRYKNEAKK